MLYKLKMLTDELDRPTDSGTRGTIGDGIVSKRRGTEILSV